MRSMSWAAGIGLGFALACGGEPPVAPPPPAVATPVVAAVPAEVPAVAPAAPTVASPASPAASSAPAAIGGGCCKTEGDWGPQWGLTATKEACASDRFQGEWVTGNDCEKVCCNTNDEILQWRARGSCRQFGMWSSSVEDAGQCKGLALDGNKVIGNPGGGEPEPVVEDELQLEDLDLPVRPAATARPRPTSSSVTKTRPK